MNEFANRLIRSRKFKTMNCCNSLDFLKMKKYIVMLSPAFKIEAHFFMGVDLADTLRLRKFQSLNGVRKNDRKIGSFFPNS